MTDPVRLSSPLSRASTMIFPGRRQMGADALTGAQATGFFWLDDKTYYLITNWHNVTGWDPINDRSLSEKNAFTPNCITFGILKLTKDEGEIALVERKNPIVDLYDDEGRPAWLEHPTYGNKVDVVAIKLGEAGDWIIQSQSINTCNELMDFEVIAGDDVFVIGFPLGLHGGRNFPIWKRASVASEPEIDLDGLPKLLVDTATRRGMSGSPAIAVRRGTINPRGVKSLGNQTVFGTAETFLGVYSGRVDDDPLGAQIGIVWKARVVDEIIKGGKRGVTPFDHPSSAG